MVIGILKAVEERPKNLLRGVPPALVLLVGLWIFLSIFATRFLTLGNHMNLLRQASVLILAACAQTLAVLGGGLNIAVGAVATLASVIAATAAVQFGTVAGFSVALLSILLLGIFTGCIIAWFRVDPIIATIGLLPVARGLAFLISNGQPVTGVPSTYRFLGNFFIGPVPLSILFAFLVTILLSLFLNRTLWGRKLYACGLDEEAARVSGIQVRLYRMITYALSIVLAAVAGILLSSRINSGQATLGYEMSLESIAAVVIGGNKLFSGEGKVYKTILGAFIITMLSNGMDMVHVSAYLRQILLGSIVILLVLLGARKKRSAVCAN
jgi:ribose transport system permease protein